MNNIREIKEENRGIFDTNEVDSEKVFRLRVRKHGRSPALPLHRMRTVAIQIRQTTNYIAKVGRS